MADVREKTSGASEGQQALTEPRHKTAAVSEDQERSRGAWQESFWTAVWEASNQIVCQVTKNDELDPLKWKKETAYGVRAGYGGVRPLLELYPPLVRKRE
jgi:hypothetical protein